MCALSMWALKLYERPNKYDLAAPTADEPTVLDKFTAIQSGDMDAH